MTAGTARDTGTQSPACRFDLRARRLSGPAGEAPLSPIACRLLELLAERGGDTVGRRELIDRLWAGNHLVGDPALNRLASEVRRAVKATGGGPLLETVHGRGYRLISAAAPATVAPAARLPAGRRSWTGLALAALVLAIMVALAFVLLLANGLVWGLAE